uniref:Uncharacterized protein n=2 Tax=Pyricularia oryzae TaxID=318829 RepID=Q2KG92_PYRO7|nr:hypothetical protein MGCH7_ch7g443 [Pyricularia oryzae 70-15]
MLIGTTVPTVCGVVTMLFTKFVRQEPKESRSMPNPVRSSIKGRAR